MSSLSCQAVSASGAPMPDFFPFSTTELNTEAQRSITGATASFRYSRDVTCRMCALTGSHLAAATSSGSRSTSSPSAPMLPPPIGHPFTTSPGSGQLQGSCQAAGSLSAPSRCCGQFADVWKNFVGFVGAGCSPLGVSSSSTQAAVMFPKGVHFGFSVGTLHSHDPESGCSGVPLFVSVLLFLLTPPPASGTGCGIAEAPAPAPGTYPCSGPSPLPSSPGTW